MTQQEDVIARSEATKQSSCFAAGFGYRVQGVTSTKMVIARAKPVAIYDFPLFLILKLKSWIPDLKRRLPHLLIPYTLIFLFPRGRGPR